MPGPFDDPYDFTSTARKVLEHDRLMRETLKSLAGPDRTALALQASLQRTEIDRFVQGFGGIEGLRDYMARASEAQRAFATAFPPDRLKALQGGMAQHTMLASSVGRDLALLAQTVGSARSAFAQLRTMPDAAALASAGFTARSAEFKAALAAGPRIKTDWASVAMPTVSVAALAELGGFTARIRSAPPSDERRVVEVAEQFGDFDAAFADAESAGEEDEREAVYTAAGRNATLVAFPSRAYPSVLVAAGWVADYLPPPPPLLVSGAVCEGASHDPADGATIAAVEGHLRHFVDSALTARSGSGWPTTFVHADKLAEWRRRQAASVSKGYPELAPIYYADFQDLLDIIKRKDLWGEVFGAVFGPRPLFEATMTRLHSIRIELAHARPLTNTARLRLEVEANSVFAALGVLKDPS